MDEVIKHGKSFIWDLEIDSYKDVYLEDFYQDHGGAGCFC